LSQKEIEESLNLLQKDWEVDPILRKFMLGKINNVSDFPIKVKDVVFHVPYLNSEKKYILWKCFWPDCHKFYGNAFGLTVIIVVIGKADFLLPPMILS
jgi:hypothetical protein